MAGNEGIKIRDPETELALARVEMARLQTLVQRLDQELIPYKNALGWNDVALRATHGRDGRGRLVYDYTRVGERSRLWAEREALVEEWGPTSDHCRKQRDEIKLLAKDMRRWERDLKYERRKQERKRKGGAYGQEERARKG